MRVLNLTQHAATAEQVAAGVVDLEPEAREALQALLTFSSLPSREEIEQRAEDIAALAALHAESEAGIALHGMIGGAPFLMAPLERALAAQGIEPVYAFSTRVSAEETQPDGSIRKTQVFRHLGFVD